MRGIGVAITLLLSVLVYAAEPSAASVRHQITCSGTLVQRETMWFWNCSPGGCPVTPQLQNACIPVEKGDAEGLYTVCDCSQTRGAEGACCHTVLRKGGPDGKGTCNPNWPTSCVGGPKCEDGDPDKDEADYFCQ